MSGKAVSDTQLRPERWVSVVLLALLATPTLALPLGKLIEARTTPGSDVWRWAGIASLLYLAAPLTGLFQVAVWVFAAPVWWPGRIIGLIFTLPTLFAAAASIALLRFMAG